MNVGKEWDVIQRRNLCKAQSWGSLEHDWFSFNFGCHITVVLFHRWRPVGPQTEGDLPGTTQLVRSWVWPKPIPATRCPASYMSTNPLFFRQKTKSQISMGKQHSSHWLTRPEFLGSQGECSYFPHPRFCTRSPPSATAAAEVSLGRTC